MGMWLWGQGKGGKETSPGGARGSRGGWSCCRNGAAPGWAGEASGKAQGYSQLLQIELREAGGGRGAPKVLPGEGKTSEKHLG